MTTRLRGNRGPFATEEQLSGWSIAMARPDAFALLRRVAGAFVAWLVRRLIRRGARAWL